MDESKHANKLLTMANYMYKYELYDEEIHQNLDVNANTST